MVALIPTCRDTDEPPPPSSPTPLSLIHLIGHFLPALVAPSLDGPLDGPDSDASSDADWNLEDELSGGPELALPPSLQAIRTQNEAFE